MAVRAVVRGLVLLVISCALCAEDAPQPRKKVLILGIDGCRPDALEKADTPTIDKLRENGAWSLSAQTGEVTVSGPGWSSMLTGVWSEKHRVRDNSFRGSKLEKYPHFFRYLKRARPDAMSASIAHWEPINLFITRNVDVAATPRTDDAVAETTIRLLKNRDPDAVFVHFNDVDEAGHTEGFDPEVPEYIQAIQETDARIARILDALEARTDYAHEDWLILVSTDHGGTGTKHGENTPLHRTIFLIASGPSAARGEITPAPSIVDVAATALKHLGVELDPDWALDGHAVGLN